jgi:hypothetical protein
MDQGALPDAGSEPSQADPLAALPTNSSVANSTESSPRLLEQDPLEAFLAQQTSTKATLMSSMADVLKLWGERVKQSDAEAIAANEKYEKAKAALQAGSNGIQEAFARAKTLSAQASAYGRASVDDIAAIGVTKPAESAKSSAAPAAAPEAQPGVETEAVPPKPQNATCAYSLL